MNKRDYEKTNDYKKSIEILKGFVRDVLDGNIEKLKDFDFTDLTTYVGDNIDPDIYLITQAIYIILWGDIYDLTFEKLVRGLGIIDILLEVIQWTPSDLYLVRKIRKKVDSLLFELNITMQIKIPIYGQR